MTSTVWSQVNDVATHEAVIVPPEMSLRTVADVMAGHDIGAVIVGTTTNVLGIVSERDIVGALAAGADPDQATAAGAMSVAIVSVRPTDTVYDAAVDMLDRGIRHVPVLDDRGEVLGMVSVRDLLRPLMTGSFER
jgi:signal-transduction protein with cAMP-binding, CBS, and nucleotidyltransferase domain